MTLSHAHSEPRSPARVVVLGSRGFLGSRLLKACATAKIAAVGIGSRDIDLTDPAAGVRLAECLRPNDAVVFLAAITPDKGRDSAAHMHNLAMGRAVAEAARSAEIAHLVYASSDAVYSSATAVISEETPAAPPDLYGAMHRARELMLAGEARTPLAVLRFTALYGTGDTHNSYGPNRFLRQALKDGRIPLFGNGEEKRDHLDVDDAVDLILSVMMCRSAGLLNVATGKSVTFRRVADLIATQAGRAIEIGPSPRQNPVTHRHFDTTNLVRAFPDARFRRLEEGLAAMLAEERAAADG